MKYLKMNEEKELLESYENDEWVPVKDLDKKKVEYQLIARNTALKTEELMSGYQKKIYQI